MTNSEKQKFVDAILKSLDKVPFFLDQTLILLQPKMDLKIHHG